MNDLVERYRRLRDKAEEAQRRADRAQGALDQVLKRLKELDIPNLEVARSEIERLTREAARVRRSLEEKVVEFEEKYGRMLEGG